MSDEEAKELLMRLFIKFNGDHPPIDTQLEQIDELFNEVIAEHRAADHSGSAG